MELSEISSESSQLSSPERTPRESVRHCKYDKLFSEAHVPTAAWEQLDNGQWACHVSRMVFATAVQCINHQRKWQYQCDLEASHLREDTAVVKALERKAQEERHQNATVRQGRNTQCDLTTETQRLMEANRQLTQDLAVKQMRLDEMRRRHRRELRRMQWSSRRQVDDLAALLEALRKNGHGVRTQGEARP